MTTLSSSTAADQESPVSATSATAINIIRADLCLNFFISDF
jgi:hypothetical protein